MGIDFIPVSSVKTIFICATTFFNGKFTTFAQIIYSNLKYNLPQILIQKTMKRLILCLFFAANIALAQHKEIIKTDNAPVPIAPYSQGVKSNGLLFVAGQVGLDPATRKLVDGGFEAETVRVMENIKGVVEAAGAKMSDIVNATIYLKDLNNFAKVNELYGKYFTGDFPARTTIGVANLPSGANIEIAVIVAVPVEARRK